MEKEKKYSTTSKGYKIKRAHMVEETLLIALSELGIGRGNSAFFTGTFESGHGFSRHDLVACKKVYDGFTHNLAKRLSRYKRSGVERGYKLHFCTVWEPHKDGAWHYHSIMAFKAIGHEKQISLDSDLKPMVRSIISRSKKSIGPNFKVKWTFQRSSEPPQKNSRKRKGRDGQEYYENWQPTMDREAAEGAAKYMSKYITKDLAEFEEDQDGETVMNYRVPKGARLVTFSRDFPRKVSNQFTIHNSYSADRRRKVNMIAEYFFPHTFKKFYWHRCYYENKQGETKFDRVKHFRQLQEIERVFNSVERIKLYDGNFVMQSAIIDSTLQRMASFDILDKEDLVKDMSHYVRREKKRILDQFGNVFCNTYNFLRQLPVEKYSALSESFVSDILVHFPSVRIGTQDNKSLAHLKLLSSKLKTNYSVPSAVILKDLDFLHM